MKLTNGIIHHEFYYEILHGVILASEEFMKKIGNDFMIVDVPIFLEFRQHVPIFLEFQQFQYHNNPLHNFK